MWSGETWGLVHTEDILQHVPSNQHTLPSNRVDDGTTTDIRDKREKYDELMQRQKEQSRSDVRCMCYDGRRNMIAVSFERSVVIYEND